MADDNKKDEGGAEDAGAKGEPSGVASAQDLMSLWGGGPLAAPATADKQKPPPAQLAPETQPDKPSEKSPKPISLTVTPLPQGRTHIHKTQPPAPTPPRSAPTQDYIAPALPRREPPPHEPARPKPAPAIPRREPTSPREPSTPRETVRPQSMHSAPSPPKKSEPPDTLPWLEKKEKAAKPHEEIGPALEGEVVTTTKKNAKRPPSPEPKSPEPLPEETEGSSFGGQFDEFLSELNLSRCHIVYALITLAVIAGIIYGGLSGYEYYQRRQKTQITQKPPTEISNEETGVQNVSDVGELKAPIPISVGETGVGPVAQIGAPEKSLAPLAAHILTFRRLQNAYATDINSLLDQSTDRRSRVRSHLALLRTLHDEGDGATQELASGLEQLRTEYERARDEQQSLDSNFFDQLDAMNAQTADDILNKFVEVSKQVVELRARFKAAQKVKSFFDQGLPKVASRIKDIELNEEALVSGIKVYDVGGSDLSIIRRVENGGTVVPAPDLTEPARSPGSAFPFLPTHPAEVAGPRDFITSPGGGFKDLKPGEESKDGPKDHVTTPGGGFAE